MECRICKKDLPITYGLQVCRNCIINKWGKAKPIIEKAFIRALEPFNLSPHPPKAKKGIICRDCSNNCKIPKNGKGYCGLVINKNNKLVRLAGNEKGLLRCYLDPHPTNCVASWCCAGGTGAGYPKFAIKNGTEIGYYNLAIFMGACSMHCLFCQNYSYLDLTSQPTHLLTPEQLLNYVNERVTCMCFFGGCLVPQMDFGIKVAKLAREKAEKEKRILRICSETNGLENSKKLLEFAEYSLESGGGIKFDLKTWNEKLSIALSGVSNKQAYKNFELLTNLNEERKRPPFLRASTLLVPHYINLEEIKNIAKFIASVDENIPYSLLAFYPYFKFYDLSFTTKKFALEALKVAKKAGLKRVKIGNIHLLR